MALGQGSNLQEMLDAIAGACKVPVVLNAEELPPLAKEGLLKAIWKAVLTSEFSSLITTLCLVFEIGDEQRPQLPPPSASLKSMATASEETMLCSSRTAKYARLHSTYIPAT